MPTVSFDIHDGVLATRWSSTDECASEMRLAAAMYWYSRGEVSQEIGAMIAGLSRKALILAPDANAEPLLASGMGAGAGDLGNLVGDQHRQEDQDANDSEQIMSSLRLHWSGLLTQVANRSKIRRAARSSSRFGADGLLEAL
jgi:hypothetical protein